MKALTLTAPYGTLIAVQAKQIETRGWRTNYRGPLAIHQAAGLGPVGERAGLNDLILQEPFFTALRPYLRSLVPSRALEEGLLPRGQIVAVVDLADCLPVDRLTLGSGFVELIRRDDNAAVRWTLTARERAFGDYSAGRHAWLLADIRALPTPIPCRGALGLWTVPADVEAAIAAERSGSDR